MVARILARLRVVLRPPTLVAIATLANSAGAATLIWLGRQGRAVAEKHTNPDRLARFERWCRRFGPLPLLLTWVPLAGDAVVLAAGVVRICWVTALAWITAGKLLRYAVVALALAWGVSWIGGQ